MSLSTSLSAAFKFIVLAFKLLWLASTGIFALSLLLYFPVRTSGITQESLAWDNYGFPALLVSLFMSVLLFFLIPKVHINDNNRFQLSVSVIAVILTILVTII